MGGEELKWRQQTHNQQMSSLSCCTASSIYTGLELKGGGDVEVQEKSSLDKDLYI